ncbi:hypothetical protein TPA0910_10920 [Streptomyces hygroscopicus subsp. sporocinereus]|uniref:Uncharacterized protein n=1 Tax=Streptomyces hygroscopicus TaxID=1912 RepID=A0ABQ3TTK5_STRHY|nr:hypothetical protein TPA0910_10920 [Streptomyces hygroscopicus]
MDGLATPSLTRLWIGNGGSGSRPAPSRKVAGSLGAETGHGLPPADAALGGGHACPRTAAPPARTSSQVRRPWKKTTGPADGGRIVCGVTRTTAPEPMAGCRVGAEPERST